MQVDSVESNCFIACAHMRVCVRGCLTPPSSTTECRRGNLLRLGVRAPLPHRDTDILKRKTQTTDFKLLQT